MTLFFILTLFNWLWDLKWYHLFHSWYYLYLLSFYNCQSCWKFISLMDIFEKPNYCFLDFSLMFTYPHFHWFLLLYLLFLFICLVLLRECVISLVLSHHNKIWSSGWTNVTALCNFLIWTSVTTPCYSSVLFSKRRKIHPWGMRRANPKEEKPPGPILAPLFICFFLLPLSLPYENWAS